MQKSRAPDPSMTRLSNTHPPDSWDHQRVRTRLCLIRIHLPKNKVPARPPFVFLAPCIVETQHHRQKKKTKTLFSAGFVFRKSTIRSRHQDSGSSEQGPYIERSREAPRRRSTERSNHPSSPPIPAKKNRSASPASSQRHRLPSIKNRKTQARVCFFVRLCPGSGYSPSQR